MTNDSWTLTGSWHDILVDCESPGSYRRFQHNHVNYVWLASVRPCHTLYCNKHSLFSIIYKDSNRVYVLMVSMILHNSLCICESVTRDSSLIEGSSYVYIIIIQPMSWCCILLQILKQSPFVRITICSRYHLHLISQVLCTTYLQNIYSINRIRRTYFWHVSRMYYFYLESTYR